MSDDNEKTNWRDRVKSPSEINEKMIGGKNSLPQTEDGKIDHEKIVEDKDRSMKKQEYDKELHNKNLDKSFEARDKAAAKEYENRMTPNTENEPKTTKGKFMDKVEDTIDKVGDGLKKAAPYLDDAAKVARGLSIPAAIYSAFEVESTATDEEMKLNELDQDAPQQAEKEPSFFDRPTEEKERAYELWEEKEFEIPIEFDMELDYEHPEPDFDGDDGSDGGDGGE